MHELSLAQSILNIVKEHVPSQRIAAVRRVRVDIGRLSGVVADSLDFCFTALVAETSLQESCLELNTIPLRLACADCRETFESEGDVFSCPSCRGSRTTVVSGMELQVTEIELEEESEEAT
jgi:hydrogenase nickel incorporation protein HypA/HybF